MFVNIYEIIRWREPNLGEFETAQYTQVYLLRMLYMEPLILTGSELIEQLALLGQKMGLGET